MESSIISMCVKGTEGFQSTGRAVIWKAAVSCREGIYFIPKPSVVLVVGENT